MSAPLHCLSDFRYKCNALKKTIESVIMIIAGGAGGDHTLLGFFNALNLVVWLY